MLYSNQERIVVYSFCQIRIIKARMQAGFLLSGFGY